MPNRKAAGPTGWPGRCLRSLRLVAALTFRDYGLGWDDYTHSQYGELLLALYTSGFRDTRALSFVNLYLYGGGFDMAAALLAKVLPFDLFETRRLAGAAVGLIGLFATWRIGRRVGGPLAGAAGADPARDLPALLRAHVHQPEGRAVRGGDGGVSARPRPPARGISEALGGDARHRRPRLRPFHRLAHHGGLRRDHRRPVDRPAGPDRAPGTTACARRSLRSASFCSG